MLTIILLTIILLLASISFYCGFMVKKYFAGQERVKGGFVAFLCLFLFVAYVLWQELNSQNQLSQHITPYPGITRAIWVPRTIENSDSSWMFKTKDTAEQVQLFYKDENNRKGWEIIEGSTQQMILRKERRCINIATNQILNETDIIYSLNINC